MTPPRGRMWPPAPPSTSGCTSCAIPSASSHDAASTRYPTPASAAATVRPPSTTSTVPRRARARSTRRGRTRAIHAPVTRPPLFIALMSHTPCILMVTMRNGPRYDGAKYAEDWHKICPSTSRVAATIRRHKQGGAMATAPTDQVGTRLMCENERVRVWDLALASGASLATHIHRVDYFFIVASGGLIRFADPANPADYHDIQCADDQVTWVPVGADGHVDNRLTNSGDTPHRNYVIELKQRDRG